MTATRRALILASLAAPAPLRAQQAGYPSRPIRVIVPSQKSEA